MTKADALRTGAATDRRVRPWVARAGALIDAKFADARAHAEKSITDTLRETPDGRPTARRATASPSYRAALNRLVELVDALAGPSRLSLAGMIRDARAAFYADSFGLWTPHVPAPYRDDSARPTKAGEDAARGAIILGRDPRPDLSAAKDAATLALFAAVNAAGRRGLDDRAARDMLKTWERRQADAMTRRVASLLADSDAAIHHAVGRILVKAEHRDDATIPIGA